MCGLVGPWVGGLRSKGEARFQQVIAEKFAVVKILVFKFLTRFRMLGKTFEDPCLVFNPIAESKSSFYAIQLRILVEHTKPYNSQTVVVVC